MPIPANMRPAGRSILGASRAIGTVAATVAAASAGGQFVDLPAGFTGRLMVPWQTFTISNQAAFPGVASDYHSATAFTYAVVFTPTDVGASDVPGGGTREVLTSNSYISLGVGATKLVSHGHSGGHRGFVSTSTFTLSEKTAAILSLNGGTLSGTFAGDGGEIKTIACGTIGSIASAVTIGGHWASGARFVGQQHDALLFNTEVSYADLMAIISRDHGIVW